MGTDELRVSTFQEAARKRVEAAAIQPGPRTEIAEISVAIGRAVVVISGQGPQAAAETTEIGIEASPEIVGRAVHICEVAR